MELTWIDDFLALEHTRNFTRAADMRHTTQSAYSRRIARLEEWLGATLFDRDARPVALTPEGSEFLGRAKLLRTDIMDTRRALQVLRSHYDQSMRLYTTNTLAIGFLPTWLPNAGKRPTSILVASTTGCLDALAASRCDCIIVPSFPGDTWPSTFQTDTIGTDQLVLMARPDIAEKIKIDKNKLHGAVMMYPPGVRYGTAVNEMLSHANLTLAAPPVCESASAEALVAQARAGLGAAFIPKMLADDTVVACTVPKKLAMTYEILRLGVG